MSIDVLQVQLTSALQRFDALQKRVAPSDGDGTAPKLVARMLRELEHALEEVTVAQEQLVEGRHRMEELQRQLTSQYEKYWQLFDEMPLSYLVTKADSTIVEANRAASDLFNISQRFLIGKTLSVFVSEDSSRILSAIRAIVQPGDRLELDFRVRPRERAVRSVHAVINGDAGSLRWLITSKGVVDQPDV